MEKTTKVFDIHVPSIVRDEVLLNMEKEGWTHKDTTQKEKGVGNWVVVQYYERGE